MATIQRDASVGYGFKSAGCQIGKRWVSVADYCVDSYHSGGEGKCGDSRKVVRVGSSALAAVAVARV